MREITNECIFKLRMKGKNGKQTLASEIFHKEEKIAEVNWCGGVSHKKGFDVKMERPEIKIYTED